MSIYRWSHILKIESVFNLCFAICTAVIYFTYPIRLPSLFTKYETEIVMETNLAVLFTYCDGF